MKFGTRVCTVGVVGLVLLASSFTIVPCAKSTNSSNNVLLVDADTYDEGLVNYYIWPLQNNSANYTVWDVYGNNGPAQGKPTALDMASYNAVMWVPSRDMNWDGSPFNAVDEGEIAEYLDGGGNFFLSNIFYSYYTNFGTGIYEQGDFAYDYLGLSSIIFNSFYENTVEGVSSDQVFDSFGPATLDWLRGNWAGAVSESDEFNLGIGTICMLNDGAIGNGVRFDNGIYKTLFFGFPFETLSQQDADEVISRVLDWFATPLIEISKAAPTYANTGEIITYWLNYSNVGSGWAEDIIFTENYPAGVTFISSNPAPSTGNNTWIISSLAPDVSGSINISMTVNDDATGILSNIVSVDYKDVWGNQRPTLHAHCNITIIYPFIDITKNGPGEVNTGEQMTYWLNYSNTGSDTAFNVQIIEYYPINVTFVSASPPPTYDNNTWDISTISIGGGGTIQILVQVIVGATGTLVNHAEVNYENAVGRMMPQTNSTAITNIIDPLLYLTKSAPPFAHPGEYMNYSVFYRNNGTDWAYDVSISESYPANVSYVSASPVPDIGNNIWLVGALAPGAFDTIQITVQIYNNTSGLIVNYVELDYNNVVGIPHSVNATYETDVEMVIPHLPIRINSNLDFDATHGVSIGNGSVGNPWVIEGWDIDGAGYGYCIYIGNTTDYFVVKNCYAHHASGGGSFPYFWNSGLNLINVKNGTLYNNTASRNNENGLIIDHSSLNSIANNSISSNVEHGLYIDYSTEINIANNTLLDNYIGIYFDYSFNNTITDSNSWVNKFGLILSNSCENKIFNNEVSQCYSGGCINLFYSDNNIIAYNNITMSPVYYGIHLSTSSGNNISNNFISDNWNNVYIESSNMNTVFNNSISNGWSGIYITGDGTGNIATSNTISDCSSGIDIRNTTNDILTGNKMYGCGVVLSGYSVLQWTTQTIDTSNLVNGNPVYYLKNQSAGTVPAGAGQIILANCTNIVIEGQTLTNTTTGIRLGFSAWNIIKNNNASLNKWYGIRLMYSDNNTFDNNTALSNQKGIDLFTSNSNSIINNNVINNFDGINLASSSRNNIYHNNIINNTNQSFDDNSTNNWNATYPVGGNYWSNYTGIDVMSGTLQDQPGCDGFGDTPYVIATYARDYYPLMPPWGQANTSITPHLPMRINSNADFDAAHGVTGGNGTVWSPWLIKNYDINGTGYGYCIYIGNTTDYFVVRNCYVYDVGPNNKCIELSVVTNGVVENVTASNNFMSTLGIFVIQSSQNNIKNCVLTNSTYGLYLHMSPDNIIENCSFRNNTYGFIIHGSQDNKLRWNSMYDNEYNFGIMADGWVGYHIEDIDTTNTVNGKPVYYYLNQANIVVDETLNFGYLCFVSCVNVTVKNIQVNEEYAGLTFIDVTNSLVENCTLYDNEYGSIFWYSSHNQLIDTAMHDNLAYGFFQGEGSENVVIGCAIDSNILGIDLCFTSNNTIANNIVSNNEYGIYIRESSNSNIISNNTVLSNGYGFYIYSSSSNMVYHNDLINNTVQAYDNTGTNFWDNGYPSGGNYWSDYTGIDIKSGPLQDQPGPDGIGDTPYTNIQGGTGAKDYYPLMSPIQFNQPNLTYFRIPVVSGWNLISTPLIPSNISLPTALLDQDRDTFWDRIQYYNASDADDHWKQYYSGWPTSLNDLTNIDHEKGVWIYVTVLGDGYINVTGTMPASTAISLKAGWNLVGYPTQTIETVGNALWGTGADKVEICDPTDPYRTKEVGSAYIMRPGEGYWVHVPADTIWVVNW